MSGLPGGVNFVERAPAICEPSMQKFSASFVDAYSGTDLLKMSGKPINGTPYTIEGNSKRLRMRSRQMSLD